MRRFSLLRAALAGLALALGLSGATAVGLAHDGRPLDLRAGELALLIALGAFLTGAFALVATELFARRRSPRWRALVAIVAVLALGVPGLTTLYGIHFGLNAYGELDFGDSLGWMHFAYAAIQGMAYFAIFGFRLMWPWGMLAIAAVALIAAPRPTVSA